MISLDDVEDAASRLKGVIRRLPVSESTSLSELAGRRILLKPEHLQRTGSFKIRGAYNRISRLTGPSGISEVVAGSAGNHAQGVALAAALCGIRSTIFMPTGASLPKLEATRHYGATVNLVGATVDEAIVAATEYAVRSGATYVPPFDDPSVIAGQGSIGLELSEEASDAEVLVVPVGGGGLISGVAVAAKARNPNIRIVGVEADGAASMRAALEAGGPIQLEKMRTMADGIAVRRVSDLTYEHVVALVDDLVTVSEEEISQAILVLIERTKYVVEPAGAASLAAILSGRVSGSATAVALLSGGNVDPLLLCRLVEHGLTAAGRYLIIRVVLSDRPGSLAQLTDAVAHLELNVLDVEHHRSGAPVGIAEVEVILTVETKDRSHRDAIVGALRSQGYRAEALV